MLKCSQAQSYPIILKQVQGEDVRLSSNERAFIGQRKPYLDNQGLLKASSRLSNAPVELDYVDPILLEHHCALWTLIVRHWHERLLHCNTSTLLVELRKQFWVPKIRQQIKKILRHCIHCRKVQAYPMPPLAQYHPNRLISRVPFRITGLDFT
ncbi:uncharacterized protein [Palaemon carinicauda]|uniref:uncharacterized protein n=1 Tax=Palaemon carinicauda TaxID=392227 RepID=UPI0035B57BC5